MAFYKQKLDIFFDPQELADGLNQVKPLFGEQNRLWVNATLDTRGAIYGDQIDNSKVENIYPVINPPFRGTIFEKVLRSLPSDFGRARVMRLRPGACMHMHMDSSPRFQLVLETNPHCFFYSADNEIFHLPCDGHVYRLNTMLPHTVFNAGGKDRYHLVVVDLGSEQKIFHEL